MFDQHFSVPIPLILREYADRTECDDFLFAPLFIRKLCLRVHDIPDHPSVELEHKIQLRYKVLMPPHDMHKIVFDAARNIHIIKGFSRDILYELIICLLLISDIQREMEADRKMCDALRELFAEELKEENEKGMEQGMERGRAEGIHLAKLIFKLSAQGSSDEEIAEKCDLPLEQVREILE